MYPELEAPSPHRRILLPSGTFAYRVQRTLPLATTVQINGLHLAPPTTMAGRFDLVDEAVAYLAFSRTAALLESVFRRDLPHQSLANLRERSMLTVQTRSDLSVLDVRGLELKYPFLVAGRYGPSQDLAKSWREFGFDGVLYASAQHPGQGCVALFEPAIHSCHVVKRELLVSKGRPLRAVVEAAYDAGIPVIP